LRYNILSFDIGIDWNNKQIFFIYLND
jgi:hypothetical protein